VYYARVLKGGQTELNNCIQGAFAEAAAATSASFELLDYEDFSADAASYVFEPSSALTADDYGEFIIAIAGKTDSVNAIPTIIFSDSTSNIYYTGETLVLDGTRSALTGSNTGIINIGNATTIPSSDIPFTMFCKLSINALGANYIAGYMETININNIITETKFFEVSATNIDKIEINMTSTGKFKADTRMAVWGLKNT
jgi:hypothetical protein